MKPFPPPFDRGIHWRALSEKERGNATWKYKLLTDVEVRFPRPICFGTYYLFDVEENHWGTISPFSIAVSAHYAWNGSSFSPDLPGVMLASVVHDLLYQFSGVQSFPFTRSFADNLFYALCTTRLAFAYRIGLFLGSWACWGQQEPGAHIATK